MSEELMPPETPANAPRNGHRFPVGHPRYGGKLKNSAAKARKLAEEMDADPLAVMLNIVVAETVHEVAIGPDGKKKRVEVPVTTAMRIDACKVVLNYLYPRLNAQQISGPNNGPVPVAAIDVAKVLSDPALVSAAQDLALRLIEVKALPASTQNESPE